MPRWQRVYLAATCAVIGFAVAYALCEYAQWPRLVYSPLDGELGLGRPPIARDQVGYFGLVLWGAGGALLSGGAAYAASLARRRPLSPQLLRLLGGWALTAVVLCGAFYTWSLWPF